MMIYQKKQNKALVTPRDGLSLTSMQTNVERGFSKAASSYEQHASVQRQSAIDLAAQFNQDLPQATNCVDLGSGPGSLSKFAQGFAGQWINVDLSHAMLQHVPRDQHHHAMLNLQGDMQRLPLQSNKIERVVSNMALQWVKSPRQALEEIYRVLKPGGMAHLCILHAESFGMLKMLWESCGYPAKFQQLPTKQEWLSEAESLFTVDSQQKQYVQWSKSFHESLKTIQQIGANHYSTKGERLSRKELREVDHAWRQRIGDRFFLDYKVLRIKLVKV